MLARFEVGVLPKPGATAEQIHRGVPDGRCASWSGLVRKLPGT
jgi:hypothetical protein